MTQQEKWQEAAAAWSEVKSGKLSNNDFWVIVHDLNKL
ncbi:hypothetical protein VPHK394_0030 [Vibrio phage K394]